MAGRRDNGEGTLRQRSDGRWEGRLPTPEGKMRFFYGQTKAEVREKMNGAKKLQDQGVSLEAEKWTVGEFLDHWLTNVVTPRVKGKTVYGYELCIRLYLRPALGKVLLLKLATHHVEKMIGDLLKRLAPKTVSQAYAVLRSALNHAVKTRLIGQSVLAFVDAPRVPRSKIKPMTVEQLQQFLKEAQGDRLEAFYILAVATGLRAGELYALKWSEVDLARGTLQVNATLARYRGKPELTEPKSESSRRMVALPAQAVTALYEHRQRQYEEKLAARQWTESNFVFTTSVGTPLNRADVAKRSFKPILERAKLPNFRVHDLRHTTASLLFWEGEHPKTVQAVLGHSKVGITMDVYSHLIPGMERSAATKLEKVLAFS